MLIGECDEAGEDSERAEADKEGVPQSSAPPQSGGAVAEGVETDEEDAMLQAMIASGQVSA